MQEYLLLFPATPRPTPPAIRPWGAGREAIYFWNIHIFFKEHYSIYHRHATDTELTQRAENIPMTKSSPLGTYKRWVWPLPHWGAAQELVLFPLVYQAITVSLLLTSLQDPYMDPRSWQYFRLIRYIVKSRDPSVLQHDLWDDTPQHQHQAYKVLTWLNPGSINWSKTNGNNSKHTLCPFVCIYFSTVTSSFHSHYAALQFLCL